MQRFCTNSTILVFVLVSVLVGRSHASQASDTIQYDNGHVTCNSADLQLSTLLEQLSDMADLTIYLADGIDDRRRIDCRFNSRRIEYVLSTVLKDCSYAVVYNENEVEQHTVVALNMSHTPIRGLNNIQIGNATDQSPDQPETASPVVRAAAERQRLIRRIDELKTRIDSGLSDIIYEKWIKVRDPKFVTHDRERLKLYQERLSAL